MRKWINENKWKIILFIVVFIIGVPLLLNWIYKMPAPIEFLHVKWDIDSELLYYGGILAALIAIYGVFFTIQISQRNNREDTRRKVLPFLTVTKIMVKSRYNAIADIFNREGLDDSEEDSDENTKSESVIYEEYNLSQIYFIIKDGKVVNYTTLPKEYDDILKHRGQRWEAVEGGKELHIVPFGSLPLEVENVGNGPAICLRIGLNKKGAEALFLPPIKLKCNQTFYIHIFSQDYGMEKKAEYDLCFDYYDIYGQEYQQTYLFAIEKDGYSIDLADKQLLIKGDS